MEKVPEEGAEESKAGADAGLWVSVAGCLLALLALSWGYTGNLFKEKPEITACENHVLAGLRSPSTYERIRSESTRVNGQLWVTLVYDAANAYGAPVRETELCRFRIKDGEVVVPNVPDPTDDLVIATRRLDALTGRSRDPCCLE